MCKALQQIYPSVSSPVSSNPRTDILAPSALNANIDTRSFPIFLCRHASSSSCCRTVAQENVPEAQRGSSEYIHPTSDVPLLTHPRS